jgi:calcineurin-like phosphoesterase family protein
VAKFAASDIHDGHKNILKYGRSKFFTDLDHMRDVIRHNWNNSVSPEDTVYLLGDVVMGHRADNLPFIEELNGRKILILGNHDYPHPCNPDKVRDKWTSVYAQYFESMHTELEIELAGQKVLLSHFPAEGDHTDEERYSEYRPSYDGWIIHGHLHVEEIQVAERHIHIGIDADWTGHGVDRFSPIPLEVVERVILS